jgi:hypothetical protein
MVWNGFVIAPVALLVQGLKVISTKFFFPFSFVLLEKPASGMPFGIASESPEWRPFPIARLTLLKDGTVDAKAS